MRVEAHLARGDVDAARRSSDELSDLAAGQPSAYVRAVAAAARARAVQRCRRRRRPGVLARSIDDVRLRRGCQSRQRRPASSWPESSPPIGPRPRSPSWKRPIERSRRSALAAAPTKRRRCSASSEGRSRPGRSDEHELTRREEEVLERPRTRALQRRDRREAVHQREDRRAPCRADPVEARAPEPSGGRRLRRRRA